MPLPVGANPTPPPGPPIILPTIVPSDAYTATWYAPDGTVWPLSDPSVGWHSLDSVSGALGAAPILMTADPYARGGSTVRHIQAQPRLITWPIRIDGPGHLDFLPRFRALARAFTQTRRLGPGVLEIQRPDGSRRQINAYYEDGFDPVPGNGSGWFYGDIVMTLYCPDPYWTDPTLTEIPRSFSGGSTSYLTSYPTVSSSQTLDDSVATNPGDVEAYPTWVITGPASGIEATNELTGESFTIDPNAAGIGHGDLLLGETVTITTFPPAVRGPDGSIWTAALNFPDAVLWALQPGDNPINVAITGSDDGSGFVMTFPARYETA